MFSFDRRLFFDNKFCLSGKHFGLLQVGTVFPNLPLQFYLNLTTCRKMYPIHFPTVGNTKRRDIVLALCLNT